MNCLAAWCSADIRLYIIWSTNNKMCPGKIDWTCRLQCRCVETWCAKYFTAWEVGSVLIWTMTVSSFTIHFVSRFVMMSSSKKRKISSKTLKEKYEAIKKLESGCANKNVAADYDVSPSTLSTWLKARIKSWRLLKEEPARRRRN